MINQRNDKWVNVFLFEGEMIMEFYHNGFFEHKRVLATAESLNDARAAGYRVVIK